MPPADRSHDDLRGIKIAGRYRVISQLGVGGMGVAYRAWDEATGVPVVVKIPKRPFLEDPQFAERFAREIRLLQGLNHPHVVPIVDVGEHEGLPFLVMRFLPGGSLTDRRLRDEAGNVRRNPQGMLHLWLPAVADALDSVHASGIVHRDVKPANIFFDAFWGAFLGDFGIAKIVAESEAFDREHTLTATSMGIGTPDYMAPEQFTPRPSLDGRTDQYALAVIAYEMLAGTRPFTGATAHLIVEVTTQRPPPLDKQVRGLPASLVAAVHRGLAKRPVERFATCREFAADVLRDVPPMADEPDLARLLCPECGNLLKLPMTAAGRKGKCPRCQTQMQVAADLGALWLLEENVGGESSGAMSGTDPAKNDAPSGSQKDFNVVSGTTPLALAASRSRQLLTWIDSHGLIATAGSMLLVTALWLALTNWRSVSVPAVIDRGEPDRKMLDPQLAAATDRAADLARQLQLAIAREDQLNREVTALQAARGILPKRVADPEQQAGTTDEPTPETLVQYRGSLGKTLSFNVVGSTTSKPVWGSNPYTADSNLSWAAVHAGVLKPGEAGLVRVTILPGLQSYASSKQNGVVTSAWGTFSLSYRIETQNSIRGLPPSVAEQVSELPREEIPAAVGVAQIALTDVEGLTELPPEEILARPPLENSLGIKLKLLPTGSFLMGSNDGEEDEKPVHEVRIKKAFYLGITEVTNREWYRVMRDNPPSHWEDDDKPVEQVSWDDAVRFCQKLSELPKERMAGRSYRLPTEAEWEYACRAGTKTQWVSGNGETPLNAFAWLASNSEDQTQLVATKNANPWGFHDMHGNVWEWCSDWYGAYDAEQSANPTGPDQGTLRVIRGGSWASSAKACRSAFRRRLAPSQSVDYLGFRIALSSSNSTPSEAVSPRDIPDISDPRVDNQSVPTGENESGSEPTRRVDLLKHFIQRANWHATTTDRCWAIRDGGIDLSFQAATPLCIELPYVPPSEYEFTVRLVREDGAGLGLVCSRDAKQFVGVIGGDFDRYAGFESVGGRHFHNGGNESSVRGSAASLGRNGVEHSVTVQVRKTKVTLLRDNEVVSDLQTDFRNLDLIEPLTSRRRDTLGVGWYEMKGRITAIEINEISGVGRLLE